ncbi:hypothetical protein EDD86DRAFT_203938 [Gorgonomyces haynaldii]|nr:hypothetical protein EDD86DRAFT_203938 [Gorgonomyces haynaldii]
MVGMIESKLRRLCPRYLPNHMDTVIKNYREATVSEWTPGRPFRDDPDTVKFKNIVSRMAHESSFLEPLEWNSLHVLDLHQDGYINHHIDHLEAFGNVIVCVSLLSDCVMEFKHKTTNDTFKILVPRRSLYLQHDTLRYDYSHAILGGTVEVDGIPIQKQRRISVMLRNQLNVHGSRSDR